MAEPAVVPVRTIVVDDLLRIVLFGDVDLAVAQEVQDGIEQALEAHPGPVVLDLGEVTFLDSYGMRALVAASARANELGRPMTIEIASDAARRVIELTGAATLFGLEP